MTYPSTSIGETVILRDVFLGASLNPAIAGTTENSGSGAIVVAQEGGVAGIITGATSGNRSQLTTGLNHLPSSGSVLVQWRVKNVTAITTRALFIGLTDTVALENPIEISGTTFTYNATDAVGFVFDTAATTDAWYVAGVASGSGQNALLSLNGENVVPTADVYENFMVELTPEGDAVFSYGKDDGSTTTSGLKEIARISSAVTPSVLLTPVALIETRTSGASTAYADALQIGSGREMS